MAFSEESAHSQIHWPPETGKPLSLVIVPICMGKLIVNLRKGQIQIKSKEGEESAFEAPITVPLAGKSA